MPPIPRIDNYRVGPESTEDDLLEAVDRLLADNPQVWAPATSTTTWPQNENRPHRRQYSMASIINRVGLQASESAVEEALERAKTTEPPEVSGHDLDDPHPGVEVVRAWIARARRSRQES